jgi:hypothetical protein
MNIVPKGTRIASEIFTNGLNHAYSRQRENFCGRATTTWRMNAADRICADKETASVVRPPQAATLDRHRRVIYRPAALDQAAEWALA